jgi:dTDP-D-glucose 4,6-dehydratase
VHISTDEVYGDSSLAANAVGKRESDVMDPTNPYAASKAAAECFVHAWRHSFGLKSVMVRMNNVYGPHQDLSKVVPKFIKQRVSGNALTIHVCYKH